MFIFVSPEESATTISGTSVGSSCTERKKETRKERQVTRTSIVSERKKKKRRERGFTRVLSQKLF
jgi:hypothetical protein